ncbi:MAG TPA: hypothetical protein DIW37_15135 [Chryseobacterium sp.]|nr:hypothetical protein [Chryseobacterium sp.]
MDNFSSSQEINPELYTVKIFEALLKFFWEVNLQKRKRNICFPTRSFLPFYLVIFEISFVTLLYSVVLIVCFSLISDTNFL